MARLAAILGGTVYLDANIFIYAVEGYAPEEYGGQKAGQG